MRNQTGEVRCYLRTTSFTRPRSITQKKIGITFIQRAMKHLATHGQTEALTLNSIVFGGHPYWEVVDVGLAGGESAYGVVGLMGNASEYEETNGDPASISGYSPSIRRGAQGGSRPTDFQAGLSRSNARESNATIRVVMLEDPVSDLAGDFDFNGEVNFLDFLNLANHFGDEQERFAKYHRGDANGDLKTDFQDFLILANSFGATSSDVSAVPEPSSSLLALLVVFPLLLARRRRTT